MSIEPRRYMKERRKFDCDALPPVLRVLFVADRQQTGLWLAESLATEVASDIFVTVAHGCAAGFDSLRDDSFDVLLVSHSLDLDASDLIKGYRAGGAREPVVVVGLPSEQEAASGCLREGADAYVCVNTITTELLVWTIARAIERHRLAQENRRYELAEQQRLQREHDEADHLLAQQRMLIRELESIQNHSVAPNRPVCEDGAPPPADAEPFPHAAIGRVRQGLTGEPPTLPPALVEHYRKLLRTYVIMGSGNLARELSGLAELLISADVSAQQTMELHVDVLEEMVRGLGSRSTRHVITRADLLVLEIMTHLAEGYRRRSPRRGHNTSIAPPSGPCQ